MNGTINIETQLGKGTSIVLTFSAIKNKQEEKGVNLSYRHFTF
jgi:hypothetical protein